MSDAIFKFKLIIIGEPGVGKTSLIKKFITGQFFNDYRASIGTNMFIKRLELENNDDEKSIDLHVWDIAGQERWKKMRHMYYTGTQGALIVGDITRKNSFNQIEDFWYPDLIKYCEKIPIVLLCNKDDLERKFSEMEANILKKNINAKDVLFTSAKEGDNVDKAFKTITKEIMKHVNEE